VATSEHNFAAFSVLHGNDALNSDRMDAKLSAKRPVRVQSCSLAMASTYELELRHPPDIVRN